MPKESERGTCPPKRNITYTGFLFYFKTSVYILYRFSFHDFICRLERKIGQTNAKIEKMERDMQTKEDLKTVALGTSKINYLDPRITVAWCKRHEVPIEKVLMFGF